MTRDEARAIVCRALHEVAPDADVTRIDPDATLHEALGLDSLDFLSFVEILRRLTGVEVAERDYPHLLRVEDCATFVASRAHTSRA